MNINKSNKFCGLRCGYTDENDNYIILFQSIFDEECEILEEHKRKLLRHVYNEIVNGENTNKVNYEKLVRYENNPTEIFELWINIDHQVFLDYIL